MRSGVSMIEVVLGAIILGLSGVTVMELVRSNTVNLQITEVEAAARGLAADCMERFSKRASYASPDMVKMLQKMQGIPQVWKDVITTDPTLNHQLPTEDVSKLLDLYDVKLQVQFKPVVHASLGDKPRIRKIEVEVSWNDPRLYGSSGSELKKVTYAALVP